jgi:hypothetical protein
MPPLRVGKARDSLRFEYRLRDFSPPHTHAPSACANCGADLLRFLPIKWSSFGSLPGEFAPASGRKQRLDAVRLRECSIGICPSRATQIRGCTNKAGEASVRLGLRMRDLGVLLGGSMASVVAFGKRSGERCNSFPMPRVGNVQDITDEVQEHPLAGGRHNTAAEL